MKFALISQDPSHEVRFWINPEHGDATSFMNWVDVWKGFHFSFDRLQNDMSVLKDFDVVMMSGNPYNFIDIIAIAEFLKSTDTVTIFYPEGSVQLYDNSINGFYRELYDAWNACDIFSAAEEDKISYYKSFISSGTIVEFIHVPMRDEMERGDFLIPRIHKNPKMAVVYGDNNPNHPMIAIACAKRMGMDVVGIDIDRGKLPGIKGIFPNVNFTSHSKLPLYPFLRILGRSFCHFYPTEWIGTARQQISCAITGTPCIGNRDSHTQKRLFPDLGCGIYDIDAMTAKAERLRNDPIFYDQVAARAFEQAKFYSLETTKKRFLSAVDNALSLKKKIIAVNAAI